MDLRCVISLMTTLSFGTGYAAAAVVCDQQSLGRVVRQRADLPAAFELRAAEVPHMEEMLDALESGDGIAFGDEGARGARRIADAHDVEEIFEAQEIRHMLDPGNAARADHPYPDASHP